jgi:hypothetical protein
LTSSAVGAPTTDYFNFKATAVTNGIHVTFQVPPIRGTEQVNIIKSTEATGPWTNVENRPFVITNSSELITYSVRDTDVKPSQKYYYALSIVRPDGAKLQSGALTVFAPQNISYMAPSTPTNYTVSPIQFPRSDAVLPRAAGAEGSFTVGAVPSGTLIIYVDRGLSQNGPWTAIQSVPHTFDNRNTTTTVGWTDSNLIPGTTYWYSLNVILLPQGTQERLLIGSVVPSELTTISTIAGGQAVSYMVPSSSAVVSTNENASRLSTGVIVAIVVGVILAIIGLIAFGMQVQRMRVTSSQQPVLARNSVLAST